MLNLRIARQMIQKILSMREWNAVLPWGWKGKPPSGAPPGFGLREPTQTNFPIDAKLAIGALFFPTGALFFYIILVSVYRRSFD